MKFNTSFCSNWRLPITTTATDSRRARDCSRNLRQRHQVSKIDRKTSLFISSGESLIFDLQSLEPSVDSSFLGASAADTTTIGSGPSIYHGASAVTASISSTNSVPVTFEPILNLQAFVTFFFITTVFSALILRTNQVEDAVQERIRRLEDVRSLKSKELLAGGSVPPEDLQQVLQLYENAVRREESLRNLIPGVRIVPPSASDKKEQEASLIAKQFLGEEFDIGVPKRHDNSDDEEQVRKMPLLPIVVFSILAMLVISQVGLIILNFSFDPAVDGSGPLMKPGNF